MRTARTGPRPFSSTWWQERGLSAMLALLVLAIFVAMPLQILGVLHPIPAAVVFTFLILSGIVAISGRRRVTAVASVLALVTLATRWAYFVSPGKALAVWGDGLGILALAFLAALLLRQVFREGPITSDRIQGAIAVYLLLGVIWGLGYQTLDVLLPGSIQVPGTRGGSLHVLNHTLMYFSFVTLTTLGYGDITPVHPFARSVAMAEALVGQLYPAILIGRLVSLQIAARRENSPK